jgi:hypothetical protein
MGYNPGLVGLGHLPSPTAWGLPARPPRPPAGYPNKTGHSEQTLHKNRTFTSWRQAPQIGGPGGLEGDPG